MYYVWILAIIAVTLYLIEFNPYFCIESNFSFALQLVSLQLTQILLFLLYFLAIHVLGVLSLYHSYPSVYWEGRS